jgi:hypothetical protein
VTASHDAGSFWSSIQGDRLLTRSSSSSRSMPATVDVSSSTTHGSVSDTALELDDTVMAAAEGDAARLDGGSAECCKRSNPGLLSGHYCAISTGCTGSPIGWHPGRLSKR